MRAITPSILVMLAACGESRSGSAVDPDAAAGDALPADASSQPDAPQDRRRSLQFDGIDDYVVISGSASLADLSAVTVEAWVKPNADGLRAIVAKGLSASNAQYGLWRTVSGNAFGSIGRSGGSCTATGGAPVFQLGAWSHVALVWTSQVPRLYINGELVTTSACSTAMAQSLNALLIGASTENSAPALFFSGLIDEVRVWNVARSQAQLQATRAERLTGTEAGLVGYWSFDDIVDDRVTDASPQANHGQLGASPSVDPSDPAPSTDVPF